MVALVEVKGARFGLKQKLAHAQQKLESPQVSSSCCVFVLYVCAVVSCSLLFGFKFTHGLQFVHACDGGAGVSLVRCAAHTAGPPAPT